VSNSRHTESKKARGKLREIMNKNKAAAAAEVAALDVKLMADLAKLASTNDANKKSMADDLTKATETFYEKLSAQQKAHEEDTEKLNAATAAAQIASANDLARAQLDFDSKIILLTNTVVANKKTAEDGFAHITGVVHDYAKAAAADRELIKEETTILETQLNTALVHAIDIGEAKAKAVEQRIAEHLKDVKRFLQVELNEQVEEAADNVLKIIEGKRQKIADNYLSLKAYAVSAADLVTEYVVKGKGRGLSSIGDLLSTIGSMEAVHAKETTGLGMGGTVIPSIFSGDTLEVSGAVAAINGLVDEYTHAVVDVRNRWPMGLGKYLMDKLEVSMLDAGVLQVDTVEGKSGNYVYINGRSVGLSNKLNDFAELASSMSLYESVLAKLTSKITAPLNQGHKEELVPPPEWQGN